MFTLYMQASKDEGLRQVQMSQPFFINAPLDVVTFKTINQKAQMQTNQFDTRRVSVCPWS